MARITSPADLNVGTEILIDEPNRIITLVEAGNLSAKDGVTMQAIYSKCIQLWTTSEYQDSPFPFDAIDNLSGQYEIGRTPSGGPNGWRWADDTTRNMVRDAGWAEYDASGNLTRIYGGFIGLGAVNEGAQPYYILDPSDAPTDFPFDDQFNAPVQVFGNATNGDWDKRTFARAFVREQGQRFSDSVLADTGATGTGAFKTNFLIANEPDLDIVAGDAEMSSAPYSGITVSYYTTDQMRNIGGTSYPFRIIVQGNGATKRQIYTRLQFLLRQSGDINASGDAGAVIGQTADILMSFIGETATTAPGVFIDNFDANDTNDYVFVDHNGDARTFPFVAAGTLTFNNALVGAGSSYRLFFDDPPGSGNNWGEAGAVTVEDANGDPIAGEITGNAISFDFDYDNNTQAGYSPPVARNVVLVGIRPGFAKHTIASGTITRSTGITIGLVAEQDRAFQA